MIRGAYLFLSAFIQTFAFADHYHPYSITEVSATIQENSIRMVIRSNAEDLIYFHQLGLDPMFNISREKLLEASTAHIQTISAGFYILDQHGKRLPARVVSTDFSSLEVKSIFGVMELLKYPLFYTLQFELDESIELLEFHQALSDAGLPAVSILSISKNNNLLVKSVELSKEKPFTMSRHAVSIGLPAELDFMVSYLSLTDTHITHELTLPFVMLKSFVPLNGKDAQATLESIRQFIATSSAVEIDKTIIQPEITTLDFQSDAQTSLRDTLLVNIRITYAMRMSPKDISVSWQNFTWQVRWFKSLIDDFGERKEHNFSRFQPTYKTKRKLELNRKEH